jgi:hypothetical protein
MMDFETKIAAAGDALMKLAADRGLTLNDFTEQESMDLLEMLMGEQNKTAGEVTPAAAAPAAVTPPAQGAEPTDKTANEQPQLDYGMVMAEVVKVAAANKFDLTTASPAELNDAVQKMAALMSDPTYATKQAAFQEKLAEADAIGRVMAHSYVDELSKIAESNKVASKTEDEKREEEKNEKKAAFVRELRAKTAGEMPEAFKKHMKGKGNEDDKGGKGDEKSEDDKKKEEAEKKASFAKIAELRAAQILIENGVNPATSEKFASADEQVDAAALNLLAQKGYKVG